MFYERIKELRNSLGINQVEFGRRLMSPSSKIQPSIDMLVKIASTFSVSADYLLRLSNCCTLDAEGLNNEQILHIRNILDDLKSCSKAKADKINLSACLIYLMPSA